jgi:hypothetical protein
MGVFDNISGAHPHIDIGGELKNRACNYQSKAETFARFCNSPPISI